MIFHLILSIVVATVLFTIHQVQAGVTEILEIEQVANAFPALGMSIGPGNNVTVVGVRKVYTPITATANDVWHIGSCAKAMTATVLAILIEHGQWNLSWTTTLREALPQVTMESVYENITIEQLTSQRSGITDDSVGNLTFTIELYGMDAPEGRTAVAKHALSKPPTAGRGEYEYANVNYILLGFIMETATNRTAEDIFQEYLFDPLIMTSVGWGPAPQNSSSLPANPWPHEYNDTYAVPFPDDWPFASKDNPPAYRTAGGIHMTLQDWSKFLTVHHDATTGLLNTALNLPLMSFQKLHT